MWLISKMLGKLFLAIVLVISLFLVQYTFVSDKWTRYKDIIVTFQNSTETDFYITEPSLGKKPVLVSSKRGITRYYNESEVMESVIYYSAEDKKESKIRIAVCFGNASRVVNLK